MLHFSLQMSKILPMEILEVMLKIVLAMALGFFLFRIKVLNEAANAMLSKLVSLAIAPCMIFSSVLSLGEDSKRNILILLIAGIAMYIIFAAMAWVVARLLKPEAKLRGVYEAVLTFGNSAFLGFPVGQALMGDIGVSYMAVLNIHQNVFCWSLGVYQLTKGEKGKAGFSIKKLLNPPIISSVIAIALYFIGVQIPDIVMAPIEFVGQICSPMSMIVVGASIASYSFASLFNNWRYYLLALFKLVVFPMIIFLGSFFTLGAGELTNALCVHAMMPTAVIVSMAAMIYEADHKTTSAVTGLMDILCIGTIPGVWALVTLFNGLAG